MLHVYTPDVSHHDSCINNADVDLHILAIHIFLNPIHPRRLPLIPHCLFEKIFQALITLRISSRIALGISCGASRIAPGCIYHYH